MDVPLEVRVYCGEVRLSWGRWWHVHPERHLNCDGEELEHVHRAAKLLESIVEERAAIITTGRGGSCRSVGAELDEWVERGRARGERVVVRSWQGTYDQVISPASVDTGVPRER